MESLGPVNPDALTEWEARFQPVAQRYRERRRRFLVVFFSGVVLLGAALALPDGAFAALAVIGGLFIAMGMAVAFSIPHLECPQCKHELERLDRFCPRCSAEAIEVRTWRGNRCRACGGSLSVGRGRHFPICYCSRCGVLVDRLGL